MRRVETSERLICAGLVSFLLMFSSVVSALAQIPGATTEPPIGPSRPNQHGGTPFGLKMAIVLLVLLALGVGFYFALRAWRSANLFQRQYWFPIAKEVPPRLGASRSGGCMATLDFARDARTSVRNQKPEERRPQ